MRNNDTGEEDGPRTRWGKNHSGQLTWSTGPSKTHRGNFTKRIKLEPGEKMPYPTKPVAQGLLQWETAIQWTSRSYWRDHWFLFEKHYPIHGSPTYRVDNGTFPTVKDLQDGMRGFDIAAMAIVDATFLTHQLDDLSQSLQIYRVWFAPNYITARDIPRLLEEFRKESLTVHPMYIRTCRTGMDADGIKAITDRQRVFATLNAAKWLECEHCKSQVNYNVTIHPEYNARMNGEIATVPSESCLVAPGLCTYRVL